MNMPKSGKVYQYLRFNANALKCLVKDCVYYADHTTFNDPFDCDVDLMDDLSASELHGLWETMQEFEFRKLGPNTILNMAVARVGLEDKALLVGNDNSGRPPMSIVLLREIKRLLRRRLASWGVLCLSECNDSTLLWAHYADKHRGLCFEYDLGTKVSPQSSIEESPSDLDELSTELKKINYDKGRQLQTSTLYSAYVEDVDFEEDEIRNAYFFRKSGDWRYEQEWRLLTSCVGFDRPPGHLSGVFFGMNCPEEIVTTIVKLLGGARHPMAFWKMGPVDASLHDSAGILRAEAIDWKSIYNSDPQSLRRDIQTLYPSTPNKSDEE